MRIRKTAIAAILTMIATILACNVSFAAVLGKKQENYRIVQVYKMDGTVSVQRGNAEKMNAYVGMNMTSGDTVNVGKDSHLYLKVDNDKYLMAEPNTSFVLEVSGTAKDSKTKITLLAGSITNRLDEKLNNKSSYEVTTSNATMAIRGTLVKTKLLTQPSGNTQTQVDLFEGMAALQLKNDQNNQQKSGATDVAMVAGDSFKMDVSSTGQVKTVSTKVDYNAQSLETLQFINDSLSTGRQLTISHEDITKLVKKKTAEKNGDNSSGNSSAFIPVDTSDAEKNIEPESRGTAENIPD